VWPSYIQSAIDKQTTSRAGSTATSSGKSDSPATDPSGTSTSGLTLVGKTTSEHLNNIRSTEEKLSGNTGTADLLVATARDEPPAANLNPVIHPLHTPTPEPVIINADAELTSEPEPDETNIDFPDVTVKEIKQDLFVVDNGSDGKDHRFRSDYVYDPDLTGINRFRPETAADRDGSNNNTFRLFGGTSDEFRYNNSESQAPKKTDVSIGDTVWSGSDLLGVEREAVAGDEHNGASASVSAGLHLQGSAGYSLDRNSLNARVSGEAFAGVSAEAEAHAELGPLEAKVEAEARAGAGVSGNATITIDPRNGLSAEVGGEAFAGAQVTLEAEAGLGDSADVGGGVDLKAGIGVEANADIDFGIDEIGVDLEIGAALGLGADFKVDVSISPTGIIDDVGDIAEGAGNLLSKAKFW